ncbi:MAG: hypothetical protein IJU29_03670 [Oscillospiraceae bacterium]|nr:hypothetical protein [Oscillospiraceae bacterium]
MSAKAQKTPPGLMPGGKAFSRVILSVRRFCKGSADEIRREQMSSKFSPDQGAKSAGIPCVFQTFCNAEPAKICRQMPKTDESAFPKGLSGL